MIEDLSFSNPPEMGILKDITFLELFLVVVALCILGEQLKNKKLFLT
jgi:hypothetical protein